MGNQTGRVEEREPAAPSTKKSGIPAPREIALPISRDRVSLRDQLRTSAAKKMIPSSSTSSLSTLSKHPRSTGKPRAEAEATDRALLECQVKELLAEAKAKDFEIGKLRMELQRCRGRGSSTDAVTPEGAESLPPEAQVLVGELREKNGKFQRELAALREENQALKEKLISLGNSPPSSADTMSPSSPAKPSLNGVLQANAARPLKSSASSGSSEFEKIPSGSVSVSSSTGRVGTELSVEGLTEQIQRMEESQHSTAEELQATLQELADQQQVVQELTAENERLAEEKGLLQTSLQQQRERVELQAQKNEALLQRLQGEEAEARAGRLAELEQRQIELVESSRFEREKLVDIQQQLTGSLRGLEKDHQEAQAQALSLREEREALLAQLERERGAAGELARLAEEHRATADALRAETSRLKAQTDIERQKVAELKAMQSAGDSTELQRLLKAAHAERERLEVSCTELRQELLQSRSEMEHIQGMLTKAEAERQQIQERGKVRETELISRLHLLEEAEHSAQAQIKDLKENVFELEDQVEQQRAVSLHTNQTILDLENQSKRLEEQRVEQEKQIKTMNKQMKDETEEWRRFQADLQTAVVVANDIKVEAQAELRALRRRLQEEQERSGKLADQVEQLQGVRLPAGSAFDTKTALEGR